MEGRKNMKKMENTKNWKADVPNDTCRYAIRKAIFIISVATILTGVVALPIVNGENKTKEIPQEVELLGGGVHRNVACIFTIQIYKPCYTTWWPILRMPKTWISGTVSDGNGLDFTVDSVGLYGHKYTEYYRGGSESLLQVRGIIGVEYKQDPNGGTITGTAVYLNCDGPSN